MGFYLRKSVKIGALRFNLSKSGIGMSVGVKGLRIGTGPRGNYIHAGRGGFYYRKTFGNTNKPIEQVQQPNSPRPQPEAINYDFKDIESGNVSFMTDSSFDDVLNEINEKSSKISLLAVCSVLVVVLGFINFTTALILAIPCIVASIYLDAKRKKTYIVYNIEHDFEDDIQKFYDAFEPIKSAEKIWHIGSQARLNQGYQQKINAGAAGLVKRTQIHITQGLPPNIVSNVSVISIPVGKQTLYFFPERILIKDGSAYGAINYKDLHVDYGNKGFVESEGVPSDTEITGHTWAYVNKNGGPDRRFKNNKQFPITKYSVIQFKSNSGLDEEIQISKPNLGKGLLDALNVRKKS